jgi:membrane-bound ClpP family serine protease
MERALHADDPKLATTLSTAGGVRSRAGSRPLLAIGVLAALVGIVLLIASIASQFLPVGIAGFVCLIGGVALALDAGSKPPAAKKGAAAKAKAGSGAGAAGAGASGDGFMNRMEERWKKRNEGGPEPE